MPAISSMGVANKADGDFIMATRGRRGTRSTKISPHKFLGSIEHSCRKCNKEVGDEDSLDCDRCHTWLHLKCSELSKDEWSYCQKNPKSKLKYYCQPCQLDIMGDGTTDSRISHQNAKIDSLTEVVRQVLKQNESIMETISKNSMKAPPAPAHNTSSVQTQVREVLNEQKERDEKTNNLMIFNLPEADKNKVTADQIKADTDNAQDVLKFLDENLDGSKLKVFRLGRRNDGDGASPRPVKVVVPEQESRQKILKNVRKMKEYTKFTKIGLCHDKTKKEIEEDRKLRAELKEKRQSSNLDYTIFNRQVVLKVDIPSIKEKSNKSKEEIPVPGSPGAVQDVTPGSPGAVQGENKD